MCEVNEETATLNLWDCLPVRSDGESEGDGERKKEEKTKQNGRISAAKAADKQQLCHSR